MDGATTLASSRRPLLRQYAMSDDAVRYRWTSTAEIQMLGTFLHVGLCIGLELVLWIVTHTLVISMS